jgi:serine protease AprX
MATRFGTRSRLAVRTVALTVLAAAVSAPAQAQRRARLSGDLADGLKAGAPRLEVILDDGAASRLAAKYNLKIKRQLRTGAVVEVTAGQLAALQADGGVDHLSGNARYHSSALGVDPIDEGIGADQVWAGAGRLPKLTGRGVTVALIDSGVDPNHWALRGKVAATVDFTGGDGVDRFGHGTHVAAIIAGRGGKSADTRIYRGVAPNASLINLRVLGADGTGSAADVIDAIGWAVDHQRAYNIRVINLSLGGPVRQSYKDDPVCAAVERAARAGLVVVVAAGNHGTNAQGQLVSGLVESPGNSPYALTVGALDTKGTAERSDDEVAGFSSNGPTAFDHVLKPDLVAPGRRIVSAEATGSLLSANFPQQHVAGSGNDSYIYGSGTSMAAGFVSGAAALLLEERPGLNPVGVKAALELSSSLVPKAGLVRSGSGSVNVLAAAEFVRNGRLRNTTIEGEGVTASGLAVGLASNSNTLVWGNGDTLVWGNGDTLVWGNGDTLVWGNGDTLVWGNGDTLVWGNGDTLVWGNGDTLVWGNSDTLVWGNGDTLVWGNSDTLVWGNSDTLVWGN